MPALTRPHPPAFYLPQQVTVGESILPARLQPQPHSLRATARRGHYVEEAVALMRAGEVLAASAARQPGVRLHA